MHAPIRRDLPIPVVISKQKDGKSNSIVEVLIRNESLAEVKKKNEEIFANSHFNKKLKQILEDVELTKSEQKKLLRDITISGADILWFNKRIRLQT